MFDKISNTAIQETRDFLSKSVAVLFTVCVIRHAVPRFIELFQYIWR